MASSYNDHQKNLEKKERRIFIRRTVILASGLQSPLAPGNSWELLQLFALYDSFNIRGCVLVVVRLVNIGVVYTPVWNALVDEYVVVSIIAVAESETIAKYILLEGLTLKSSFLMILYCEKSNSLGLG